jgi:hypothetical protein
VSTDRVFRFADEEFYVATTGPMHNCKRLNTHA